MILQLKMAVVGYAQRRCKWCCDLECEQDACANPMRTLPPTHWGEPYKATPPTACPGEHISQNTHLIFAQRRKLSFASESNSVLFHWLQQHRAGRPWSGTDLGGLVIILGAHIWLIWGILNSDMRVYFPIEGLDNGGSMIWNTIPSERATVKISQVRISNFYITLWPRARIRIQSFPVFSLFPGDRANVCWCLDSNSALFKSRAFFLFQNGH